MEIFLHSAEAQLPTVVEVEETMTVREVLVTFGSEEDGFWIEDFDEEISLDLTIHEVGVGHRGHVHHNRCRRVEVNVLRVDEDKSKDFAPASTVLRVLKWALGPEGFNIPDSQWALYGFLSCDLGTLVPNDTHVGSLVVRDGKCQACLSLVLLDNPQG